MKDETDESLMARYATGDIKAFDTLYARHNVSIYSYIKKSAKDPDVAAELTQALWEKLIKNTDSLSSRISEAVPPFALKPYLFRMADNLINDHYRLSDTKVSSAANSPSPDGDDPMVLLADDNQISPEDAGILQELSNCIERRLATVSDEFRNTFELTRDNILSYAEAAETFNLSIETIKSRVKTVLKKIRPCLKMHNDQG